MKMLHHYDRRAERSQIGPMPRDDDPLRGRPDGPRRRSIGDGPFPHRPRGRGAACSVTPYFHVLYWNSFYGAGCQDTHRFSADGNILLGTMLFTLATLATSIVGVP